MFKKNVKQVILKTAEQIELIRVSADLLGRTHGMVAEALRPGLTTLELDKMAHDFIKDHGGIPSFLGTYNCPSSTLISVNEVVVHGLPSKYILKEGDIVSVDMGVKMNGFHSDSAFTYWLGEIKPEVKALLKATYESLYKGIDAARVGNTIGDIGYAVQNHVQPKGYSVVRELIGHGLGESLHEPPEVPNYGKRGSGPAIENGMVIAIEPMINLGRKDIVELPDGWTIRTVDKKPSAHYEHTVAIWDNVPQVLTTFKYIEHLFSIEQL